MPNRVLPEPRVRGTARAARSSAGSRSRCSPPRWPRSRRCTACRRCCRTWRGRSGSPRRRPASRRPVAPGRLPARRLRARALGVKALAASVGGALTDPGLLALYLVGFLLMGCFVTVYNYLDFRLLEPRFHLSQAVVGLIFVAYLAGSFSSTA